MGFTGQLCEGPQQWYPLGNGYRIYSPILMRFLSPDSLSPFGLGGIHPYLYCAADPVNWDDPTGHIVPSVASLATALTFEADAFLGNAKTIVNNAIHQASSSVPLPAPPWESRLATVGTTWGAAAGAAVATAGIAIAAPVSYSIWTGLGMAGSIIYAATAVPRVVRNASQVVATARQNGLSLSEVARKTMFENAGGNLLLGRSFPTVSVGAPLESVTVDGSKPTIVDVSRELRTHV